MLVINIRSLPPARADIEDAKPRVGSQSVFHLTVHFGAIHI